MESLSNSEEFTMYCIWRENRPMGLSEIVEACTSRGQEWKTQTVSTFISRLMQKNYLGASGDTRNRRYYPLISEQNYIDEITLTMTRFWGKAFFKSTFSSLCTEENSSISPEDAEEIRKILDGFDK